MNDKISGIDFEKMNEMMASPEFANWYYNYVKNNENSTDISSFVNLMQDKLSSVDEFNNKN